VAPDLPAAQADPSPGLSDRAAMFANRIRKNLRHLGRWARRSGVTCYRLYDADLPEYAVAIDLYEGWIHVQEYAPPPQVDPARAAARLADVLATLPFLLDIPPNRIVLKVRERQRGTRQYERLARTDRFQVVTEAGLRFAVNLTDSLDTGLFLDHRPTRAMLKQMAAGTDFLNLFAYTGAASVYAAAGGARATTSVDLSSRYLAWARRNMALNGFLEGPRHRFERADCLAWLQTAPRGAYSLIFLDPPTFSNSKRMRARTLDIQRDHVRLIRACLPLLAPDGTLVFSTNHRQFRLDAAALAGLDIQDISAPTIPLDFARNPRIHRCFRIRRPTP
jgi:23S rRNA (guanine2445-N2)-methyltransferase / 23S rRNA (guanine2069-N7)-methyltransferase